MMESDYSVKVKSNISLINQILRTILLKTLITNIPNTMVEPHRK